jgi:phosphoribosylformylglycinamidine synthase
VTKGGQLNYFENGELVASTPAEPLVLGGGAPVYEREYTEPAYFKEYKKFDINSITEPIDYKKVGFELLANPNIASKRWVYEQYDSMVGTKNMSTNAPSDAGIVNVKGTNTALAMTVDCNSRYVHADPIKGTEIAVSEAARNIVCSGGIPSAITNCLNFGNPYNPESYWQFVGAIKGMSNACLKFGTPVTGGNVSFYNQTSIDGVETPVFPTPTIGMIGIVEDKANTMSLNFKQAGETIFLLGESKNDISSSEYLANYIGVKESTAPFFDLEVEYELQETVKGLIKNKLVNAAHDCADGGLWVTLTEMAYPNNLGFDIATDDSIRKDAFLFGEAQSRVVVTVKNEILDEFIEFATSSDTPFSKLGTVTTKEIIIDNDSWGNISEAKSLHLNSLGEKLN